MLKSILMANVTQLKIPQGVSTEQLLTLTAGEMQFIKEMKLVPLIEIAHARSGDKKAIIAILA